MNVKRILKKKTNFKKENETCSKNNVLSRVQPITNENSVVEGKLFPNRIYKTIKVKGLTLAAIIDIGSDVCIINQDVFNMLNG